MILENTKLFIYKTSKKKILQIYFLLLSLRNKDYIKLENTCLGLIVIIMEKSHWIKKKSF